MEQKKQFRILALLTMVSLLVSNVLMFGQADPLSTQDLLNKIYNATSKSIATEVASQKFYELHPQDQTADTINTTIVFNRVIFFNEGPNSVYVEYDGTTATTADLKIAIGERWTDSYSNGSNTNISMICASGETATVRVYAARY